MPLALVVDDAADIRLLLRHLLGRAGFEVVEASSGPGALDLLAAGSRPDLAIIDVQMPDMDGWDTLRGVRRHRQAADLPVILCTVKSSPTDLLRAWELGCDGYLAKPFAIAEVIDEVRAVLARTDKERLAVRATRRALVEAEIRRATRPGAPGAP